MVSPFPPQPSVEHLVTVFRRINACNILVPAFQRSFVWHEPQVLALMESVYQGFPIGSILLWRVDSPILKRSESDEVPFPKGDISYPADFVLDGLQRLSSLYGVFNFGVQTKNRKFDIAFDLRRGRFVNNSQVNNDEEEEEDESALRVPLNALFAPRSLIGIQTKLLKQKHGDSLVEKVLELQSRFQEYMLPLVTLSQRRPEDVVSIFERVNSTGTKLSAVDFMRAITWSSQFDLNRELAKLARRLEAKGFEFDENTLVKALALVFNLDPLPEVMLKLREQGPRNLDDGMKSVLSTALNVIEFMQTGLKVYSRDYMPYEGQFLVLFNVLRKQKELDEALARRLASWFLGVSASEAMQGRPDHYIARTIKKVTSAIAKGELQVPPLRIDQAALMTRPMLKGSALTAAIITTMARRGVRDLEGGKFISTREFMGGYETNMISPVLDVDTLSTVTKVDLRSAKTIGNSVLHRVGANIAAQDAIIQLGEKGDAEAASVLESQLIPMAAAKDLAEGRKRQFLEKRGKYIVTQLQKEIAG